MKKIINVCIFYIAVISSGLNPSPLCASEIPAFAVKFANLKSVVFDKADRQENGKYYFERDSLNAVIQDLGDDKWQLDISNKASEIKELWFPWISKRIKLNDNLQDDIIYYPYLFGTAVKNTSLKDWGWKGLDYPGTLFAPIVILADGTDGVYAASINWPPIRVQPTYSKDRIAIKYPDKIPAGGTFECSILFSEIKADSANSRLPWQIAVEKYKIWLEQKMEAEQLYPINYSQWVREIDGFLNIQLENITSFNISEVYKRWNKWNIYFPWVQFWGQMSDYAGKPGGGCCLDKIEMHPRYIPELVQFAKNITTLEISPGHAGYYSRPHYLGYLYKTSDGQKSENLNHLLQWLSKNKEEYYANVFYIDTFGGRYFGYPLQVAKLFKSDFPKDTFIEYAVDIYPTAFVISGSLGGGNKKKGKRFDDFERGYNVIAFPRLGRYLLNDRIIFLGESNNDYNNWGWKNDYFCERQVFLLGAKFDVMHPGEKIGSEIKPNSALTQIISERKRVSWWKRSPKYFDTIGIKDIPPGAEVRKFQDVNGRTLFVVENWALREGLSFTYEGNQINIPQKQLQIIERE